MKTITTRIKELEALQAISPASALAWLAEDQKHYHWHGHEGTFSLDEIEAQIKPNGRILIWDMAVPVQES